MSNNIIVPVIYLNVNNLNNRVYTVSIIEKLLEIFNNKIEHTGQLFGCIGYPSEDNFNIVDLEYVSHSTSKIFLEDNILFAEISILDTNSGRKLKNIIDDVVFRPRMVGIVNETFIIEDIISFDAVTKDTDAFNMEECKIMLEEHLKNK